ncbi:sensor histidine kinase, partial [Parabacteroides sp. OttesenSCG-928-G07]|nr:sensor histidine kinase [Parabacteroides sp. OttesenSCG-928-G07]
MLNRRLHRIIVSATIGIVLCSVVGAWLLFSRTSLFVAFICFLIVVALAITLVREMEKTDRQLEKFFSAIRHRDFN